MKKRVLCFLLSAVMLLGAVVLAAPQAHAVSAMKVSEDCIAVIKLFEGFSEKAYFDYGHWSIGYGTTCGEKEYPNGITREKADALLRKSMATYEKSVNNFIDKYKLTLRQGQFDALVSFTYNLGSSWMNDRAHLFTDVVISGATGNDFLYAIARWSTVTKNGVKCVEEGLVRRRLIEANMYLNGIYKAEVADNFRYILFDNNLTGVVNDVRVQAFDAKCADIVRAVPARSGYCFLGWYTEKDGGEWATELGAKTTARTLYAHWQKGSGELGDDGKPTGVPAKYQLYGTNTPVLDAPAENAKELRKLGTNERVTIVADYMDETYLKWGKLSGGGWVELSRLSEDANSDKTDIEPVNVHVLQGNVNIRSGPGTNYPKRGTFTKGQSLKITAVQKGGQYQWGKCAEGWVCLMYTDYDTVMAEKDDKPVENAVFGVVKGTDKLNIRAGAGTIYSVVGSLKRGDQVTILEQKKVGTSLWGRMKNGWVSMYYIDVLPDAPAPTEPAPTEPDKKPDPTEPTEKPAEPEKPADKVVATGTIVSCSSLRIRAGAGTQYPVVGSLALGTQVELYEMTTAGSQVWGRTSKGWISLTYVSLDTPGSSGGNAVGATVVKCTKLNVRTGAGVAYARVCQLEAGTKVKIYEQTAVGGKNWARIDQGWVHMDYIRLDSAGGSGGTGGSTDGGSTTVPGSKVQSGVIVKTDELRVRAAAGVGNKQVGTLKRGDKVVILETAKVGTVTWGRMDKGWISMYYVQVDRAEVPSGSFVGTVTAANLRIRAAAGTSNKQVGTYAKGTQVVILETTKVGSVTWGRTDKGWISLYYVK